MPWLLALPGHHQPRYWLYSIRMFLLKCAIWVVFFVQIWSVSYTSLPYHISSVFVVYSNLIITRYTCIPRYNEVWIYHENCTHDVPRSAFRPEQNGRYFADGIFKFTYPWASVHRLVQCTLECHWNATAWPSVHWDTTGRPSDYLQGTLEHNWKKLSWNSPTLECHWRNLV